MFVIYDKANLEIKKAGAWTEESVFNELEDGLEAGIIKTDLPRGALKNYVFVADAEIAPGQKFPEGRLERKPQEECDLLAEEEAEKRENTMHRFHHLNLSEVIKVDVFIMVPSVFRKIEMLERSFQVSFDYAGENHNLNLNFSKRASDPISFVFGFGGCAAPFRYVEIRFSLTGKEGFLRNATEYQLGSIGPNVWTSGIIKERTIRFSIAIINKLIESYRIAFLDPYENLIGPADILNAALVITLNDGIKCTFSSGLNHNTIGALDRRTPENAESRFQELLRGEKPDFFSIATFELRKAYLYGQHRESVIWAATVVNEVIREILIRRLPRDSSTYNKIANSDKNIKGADKRGKYFKQATGYTLKEYLSIIISRYDSSGSFLKDETDQIWAELPARVEELLELRNQILHRRRMNVPMDATTAYKICMNFINAVTHGWPMADDVRIFW